MKLVHKSLEIMKNLYYSHKCQIKESRILDSRKIKLEEGQLEGGSKEKGKLVG